MGDDALPIVAYGSARGSSEQIAKGIAGSLGVEAVALNQLDLKVLQRAPLAVFVCSTINNGNVPRNADLFFRKLEAARSIGLGGVRFALLALGSSYYSTFCRAGDALYKMLIDRGAAPFVAYVRPDAISARTRLTGSRRTSLSTSPKGRRKTRSSSPSFRPSRSISRRSIFRRCRSSAGPFSPRQIIRLR
jgi:sulfite reductase alpha subunit-like flavoprotein